MMIGASVQRRRRDGSQPERDYSLMKEAGIDRVRFGFRTPFVDAAMGDLTPEFREQEREIELLGQHGFKVMGYSPFPGGDPDIGGHFPARGGSVGSDGYLAFYEEVCAWLAKHFESVVDAWQVANEMNSPDWSGDLTSDQGVEFLRRGGRGLKRGNPDALVGVNMAGFDDAAMYMYGKLFPNDTVDFDYVGADGYFGSYQPGGPERWGEKFDQLAGITGGKPIVVQEFGYPSAGGTMTTEEQRKDVTRNRHILKAWPYPWDGRPRTPEDQAEYVLRCMEIFANDRRVIGVFVWRWNDGGRCWLCGSSDCPITGNWGLVDLDERPKPAFHAFQEGAAMLRNRAS